MHECSFCISLDKSRPDSTYPQNLMIPLVAFVSMFVESSHVDDVVEALSRIDNVQDVFEVTGEFDIVSIVSAPDIDEFRDILKNGIMKIEGVRSTVTSIVLNPHKGISQEEPSEIGGESAAVNGRD